jgi:hypothetical protein
VDQNPQTAIPAVCLAIQPLVAEQEQLPVLVVMDQMEPQVAVLWVALVLTQVTAPLVVALPADMVCCLCMAAVAVAVALAKLAVMLLLQVQPTVEQVETVSHPA